jgi:drug/metabolite transporter (DMT)-like permease
VILGGDVTGGGIGPGEIMALLSGLAWAVGAALMFTARPPNIGLLGTVSIAGSAGTMVLVILIGGPAAGTLPSAAVLEATLMPALGAGFVYFGPLILLTLWSALRLAPATMSFLLTAEIVSGIGSAALMLDEPFGLAEALGTVLIVSAALAEVVIRPTRRPVP